VKILSVLMAVSIFSSCLIEKVQVKVKDNDGASAWLNSYTPTNGFDLFEGEKIKSVIIPDKYKAEYITRLNINQFVELNEEDYFLLTGNFLKKEYGLVVRAVYTHGPGHFAIYQSKDDMILVEYGYNGSGYNELNKTGLIIETDILPKEFYVSFLGIP
jgi:hypothetical protein